MKKKLKIIFEDKNLLIIYKDSGILTINKDNTRSINLYSDVYEYLHKKNQKVFIVHRLDKDTCGLIIFAKNEKVKRILQDNWEQVKRGYVALVNNRVENKHDIIQSYLYEDSTYIVRNTNDKNKGKLAITEYSLIKYIKDFSLLDITIHTGRKNQIRVQLNDIGHSIVGDKKYSKIKNKNVQHLCLCANYLKFNHPITKNILEFRVDIPKFFYNI